MASFTDQVPQFNPYVQQMPVEAMIAVGAEKQRRYDEGVQKIQTQIDNVAGLDIIRDIDKQYLQSKLNSVGNNLKTVAAGDFSNYQLVNSTNGMISQVARDPIVQNSVISTQKVRKSLSDKETANKNGKGSVENDWWLDKDIDKYINDPDQKASFSGGYIEYRDIKPKMIEVLKSLHESGTDEQIPWVTDANGTVHWGKTADAMVEKGWKGITSGKIENAIRASFDQNDLRQFQISGQYQFKDYTPQDLERYAHAQYNTGIAIVKDDIARLQKLAVLKNNPNDMHTYNEIMDAIKEKEKSIGEGGDYQNALKSQLDYLLQGIKSNPDAVKGELYKDGFVKEFSKAHSWEETSTKYVTNPYKQVEQFNMRFALDVRKQDFYEQHSKHGEWIAEETLKLKQAAAGGGAGFQSSLNMPEDQQMNAQVRAKNDIDNSQKAADAMLQQMADELQKKAGPNAAKIDIADVQKMIMSVYDDGPMKSNIPADLIPLAKSIVAAQRDASLTNSAYKSAVQAANNDREILGIKREMDIKLADHNPLTINVEGRTITYTPQDIVNLLIRHKPAVTSGGIVYETAIGDLSRDEQLLIQNYPISELRREYKGFMDSNHAAIDKYNEVLNREILTRIPEYVPKRVNLGSSEAQKKQYHSWTTQLLGDIKGKKGGNEGLNPETLHDWLSDEKNVSKLEYTITNDGSKRQLVVGLGQQVQKIDLTEDVANQFQYGQTTIERRIKDEMLKNNGTTQAPGGSPMGAAWSDLPNLRNTRAVGDVKQVVGNPDMVIPILRFKVKTGNTSTWKTIEYGERSIMPIAAANAFFMSLTDEALLKEIKIANLNIDEKDIRIK